jgi:SNF2 family DNA or RNA helicase
MGNYNEYSGGTSVLDSETLELRNYQLEGALEILERRRAILADDMGLGKTATALNVINVLKKRNENAKTLIVCPGSTIPHWYKEATKLWCPEENNYYSNFDL